LTIAGLKQPFDVLVAGGKVYVAESGANRVGIFDAESGASLGGFEAQSPRALALLSTGRLAVSCAAPGDAGAVILVDPENSDAPPEVLAKGQFDTPWGIAEKPGGGHYVADMQHKRVIKLKPDGTEDGEITLSGAHLVTALLRTGSVLLIAESTAHRVVAVDPGNGETVGTVNTGPSTYPQGLAVDGRGHLFIALTGSHQIAMLPVDDAAKPRGETTVTDTQPDRGTVPARARILSREALTVVAFGDSVTFGAHMQAGDTYPEQLQVLLDTRYGPGVATVINAGIGGNTSGAGPARLERDVLAHKPDIVLVNFGLNDSAKTGPQWGRGVPDTHPGELGLAGWRAPNAGGLQGPGAGVLHDHAATRRAVAHSRPCGDQCPTSG